MGASNYYCLNLNDKDNTIVYFQFLYFEDKLIFNFFLNLCSLYFCKQKSQIVNAIKIVKENNENRREALLDIVNLFYSGLEDFKILIYI